MELSIDGIAVSITHPDRPLFPDDGFTKGDVASYYAHAAGVMAPFLKDRIISVERFPQGVGGKSFYQRHAAKYYPDYIRRVSIRVKKQMVEDVLGDPPATIVFLANLSCVTFHTWLSRAPELALPDVLIFDLDPSRDDDFATVCRMALVLRDAISARGLVPYVKTTGSRGLHVAVPIQPQHDFENVRPFIDEVAAQVVREHPEQLTLEFLKKDRGDRIFLDTFRNGYGASAVAPYSLRPRRGAPVAAPIPWEAVESGRLRPDAFTIRNVDLDPARCPWRDFLSHARKLQDLS